MNHDSSERCVGDTTSRRGDETEGGGGWPSADWRLPVAACPWAMRHQDEIGDFNPSGRLDVLFYVHSLEQLSGCFEGG